MDDIGNPVINARWARLEFHEFPQIFWILTGIPRNSFKVLQNSGIPQDFESAGFGILHKLLLSFLEILKFLGTQFSVVHRGCMDIFWNSPLTSVFIHCFTSRSLFTSNLGSQDKIPGRFPIVATFVPNRTDE